MARRAEFEERGEEIVKMVAAMFRRDYQRFSFVSREDAISEGVLGVYERAEYYDPARGSFSSFVYLVAKSRIARYIKKEYQQYLHNVDIEGLEDAVSYKSAFYEGDSHNMEVINKEVSRLDAKKGSVVSQIIKGRTMTEIANENGISKQYVSHIFKKFKAKCAKKYELKEGEMSERGK